jgi:hypothetical protein
MNVTDLSQVLAVASVEFLHNSLGGAPATAVIKQHTQHLDFVCSKGYISTPKPQLGIHLKSSLSQRFSVSNISS